jgi:hypothetical protein
VYKLCHSLLTSLFKPCCTFSSKSSELPLFCSLVRLLTQWRLWASGIVTKACRCWNSKNHFLQKNSSASLSWNKTFHLGRSFRHQCDPDFKTLEILDIKKRPIDWVVKQQCPEHWEGWLWWFEVWNLEPGWVTSSLILTNSSVTGHNDKSHDHCLLAGPGEFIQRDVRSITVHPRHQIDGHLIVAVTDHKGRRDVQNGIVTSWW